MGECHVSSDEISKFKELMRRTDIYLNDDASRDPEKYRKNGGLSLEHLVRDALVECSEGTIFEGGIDLVSGHVFPDIIVSKRLGVEVKSTKDDKWQSTGSSILESTRPDEVEYIYMTFGKLGGVRPEFRSKPYQDCLSDIAVTHYPRYKIDMNMHAGETIFDKMDVPYDQLRIKSNPVPIVADYYKKHLKSGQELWWAQSDDTGDSPLVIQTWTSLPRENRNDLKAHGLALFPELLVNRSPTKYQRYQMWLLREHSVIDSSMRDQFSAGGKVNITANGESFIDLPQIFSVVNQLSSEIKKYVEQDVEGVSTYWDYVPKERSKLEQWCMTAGINAGGMQYVRAL